MGHPEARHLGPLSPRLRSAEGLDDAHGISAIGFASCGLLLAIAWKLLASFP